MTSAPLSIVDSLESMKFAVVAAVVASIGCLGGCLVQRWRRTQGQPSRVRKR